MLVSYSTYTSKSLAWAAELPRPLASQELPKWRQRSNLGKNETYGGSAILRLDVESMAVIPSNNSWYYLGKLSYFTNLNSSAILGWFPLLTMIPVRENSEVVIIYPETMWINHPGKRWDNWAYLYWRLDDLMTRDPHKKAGEWHVLLLGCTLNDVATHIYIYNRGCVMYNTTGIIT